MVEEVSDVRELGMFGRGLEYVLEGGKGGPAGKRNGGMSMKDVRYDQLLDLCITSRT